MRTGSASRQRVDPAAVEGPGHGLVIADAADPAVAEGRRAQSPLERARVAHLGRTAAQRGERSGEREQVDVVVVKAREGGATARVVGLLARRSWEAQADRRDAPVANQQIPRRGAGNLRADDQHAAA